jgi:hypothetical protein
VFFNPPRATRASGIAAPGQGIAIPSASGV